MSAPIIKLLLVELYKELDDRNFFTIDDLITLGVFGSAASARMALKKGKLAFVKISPRRRVIPRAALLSYLQSNFSEEGVR